MNTSFTKQLFQHGVMPFQPHHQATYSLISLRVSRRPLSHPLQALYCDVSQKRRSRFSISLASVHLVCKFVKFVYNDYAIRFIHPSSLLLHKNMKYNIPTREPGGTYQQAEMREK